VMMLVFFGDIGMTMIACLRNLLLLLWVVAEEHPFGVVSLYLTDSTCKMFSIDKKEAKNNQHFVVDTKSVKEDISLKGAISDFHVVKGSLMVGLTLINLVKIKQQFERPYTS
jgi:hypothetical protein